MKNFITFIFVKVIKITANILDKDSIKKYQRINPFLENIFDWKERGKLWSGNKNVTIYNSTTLVGDVEIGENTWIGPFCSIDGTGGLKIGSNCSISASVHIQTHSTVKWAISGGQESYEYKSVSIGDNCFIGVGAIILPGVNIGSGSIVGAGTVVTKSCPENSKIVGPSSREI